MFIRSEARPCSFNTCLDISQVGVDQFSKISEHNFLIFRRIASCTSIQVIFLHLFHMVIPQRVFQSAIKIYKYRKL